MSTENFYEEKTTQKGRKLTRFKRVFLLMTACLVLSATARADVVTYWNEVASTAIVRGGKQPAIHLAMVHAAIYDAVNSIDRRHTVFAVKPTGKTRGASQEAAAASAAYHLLVAILPEQQATLDAAYATSLSGIPDDEAKSRGIEIGEEVAAGMMAFREGDGRNATVQYVVGSGPGVYQLTPPAFGPPLSPWLANVRPFTFLDPSQFRPEGPPALNSERYAADLNEVKSRGALNSTERTPEETVLALFNTENPTTFYGRNFRQFADAQGLSVADNARLFAMLFVTWGDALIACWDGKYHFNFWRPITAIRAADTDDNPMTDADPGWTPLVNTPAHPEYPAGHGTSEGAFAEILRRFFGTKHINITFNSTVTNTTHSFENTDDMIKDMIEARICGGMHFRSAVTDGTVLGKKIAKWVAKHYFRPVE